MGNAFITPCFRPQHSTTIKLISYGGATRILTGKPLVEEIVFENPDLMVCHADSFFIGQPIPSLSIDDELIPGQTYFLLPFDSFTHNVLSVSSISGLGSVQNNNHRFRSAANFKQCPFEYVNSRSGKILIKVVPEFIIRLISRSGIEEIVNGGDDDDNTNSLCSTPELVKDYKSLVSCRDQIWSPKLDTISEYKIMFSPCRFLGLEWKQRE